MEKFAGTRFKDEMYFVIYCDNGKNKRRKKKKV